MHKCGKIVELFDADTNGGNGGMVKLKLDDSDEIIEIHTSMLQAPKGTEHMSLKQLDEISCKPFEGRKIGERVCVLSASNLWS